MNSIFSWGRGDHGQLGIGGSLEETFVSSPTLVKSLSFMSVSDGQENVVQLDGGDSHSALLTESGRVFVCGSNDHAQLGHEKTQSRFEQVSGSLESYAITQIACGYAHNLAVDEWGKVFSWGSDDRGQLGHNSGAERWPTPKLIRGLGPFVVVQVAAGFAHSLVLTDSGRLFSFGDNLHGQLGIGPSAGDRVLTPQPVDSLYGVPIKSIACGGHHSVVVSVSGAVFAWGRNSHGQLGIGNNEDKMFPTQVRSLRSQRITKIACGESHTVCLTADGGVFTFGRGSFGQLGHGGKVNESVPRKVIELMGTEVSQIACGKQHTLTFIPTRGNVYGFGLGGAGQLGRGTTESALTPQTVLGPWVKLQSRDDHQENFSKDCHVSLIGAGGDHSLVALSSQRNANLPDHRQVPVKNRMKCLTQEMIDKIGSVGADEVLEQDFLEQVETIFQSAACLNGSLLTKSHEPCSSKNCGVHIQAWMDCFAMIQKCQSETLQDAIYASLTMFVLPRLTEKPPDVESLRIYLIVPLYHRFGNVKHFEELQVPYASRMINLEKIPWGVIEKWLLAIGSSYFKLLVLRLKSVAVHILKIKKSPSVPDNTYWRELNTVMILLRSLNRINVENNLIIEYEDFYIQGLHELVDLPSQYLKWLNARGNDVQVPENNICNFPFAFDASAKTQLLQTDQGYRMHLAVGESNFRSFTFGMIPPEEERIHCLFRIRRNHLVEDTLNYVMASSELDLKKPLRIQFVGEEAEDAGGVKKEFFLFLIKEILDPKYGMFKYYEETRTIWFQNSDLFVEEDWMYFLIGVICGLAIYNFTIINLPFPLALYKKLLGNKVGSLEDLAGLTPSVAKGMRDLLDYDGDDVEDVFCLTFTISEEFCGQIATLPLKEGGEKIPVTKTNKEEYVSAYCDYVLNKSVSSRYNAFHKGFHKVCGGRVLDLFQARELMTLVVGNEHYDWKELEESTTYRNGYDANHPTIKNFWSVFHELSLEDKKNFLLFLTGCDRIPILGTKSLQLVIQKSGDTNFLPVAHTCFNLLDLPEYATRERLKYKLLKAIQQTEGFGLV